jgi:hypothetical protein
MSATLDVMKIHMRDLIAAGNCPPGYIETIIEEISDFIQSHNSYQVATQARLRLQAYQEILENK